MQAECPRRQEQLQETWKSGDHGTSQNEAIGRYGRSDDRWPEFRLVEMGRSPQPPLARVGRAAASALRLQRFKTSDIERALRAEAQPTSKRIWLSLRTHARLGGEPTEARDGDKGTFISFTGRREPVNCLRSLFGNHDSGRRLRMIRHRTNGRSLPVEGMWHPEASKPFGATAAPCPTGDLPTILRPIPSLPGASRPLRSWLPVPMRSGAKHSRSTR